ncbi:hypothetical protein C8R43DRAFT_1110402 [Mycena crocata]|nr:hypothetical protein C8R43DRAFT_1110402 [Mycena crocata]
MNYVVKNKQEEQIKRFTHEIVIHLPDGRPGPLSGRNTESNRKPPGPRRWSGKLTTMRAQAKNSTKSDGFSPPQLSKSARSEPPGFNATQFGKPPLALVFHVVFSTPANRGTTVLDQRGSTRPLMETIRGDLLMGIRVGLTLNLGFGQKHFSGAHATLNYRTCPRHPTNSNTKYIFVSEQYTTANSAVSRAWFEKRRSRVRG